MCFIALLITLVRRVPPNYNTLALNKNYVNQVTPEQVIENFAEHGQIINVGEAEKIIEFIYMLAKIAVDISEEELKNENKTGSNPNGFKTGSE